jgi:U2 small nuclear ribonucleoprotein A'
VLLPRVSESETHRAPQRLTRAAMVKLTPELLAQAPSALNPVKERQLDLRGEFLKNLLHLQPCSYLSEGYKIPTIENLGVTKV